MERNDASGRPARGDPASHDDVLYALWKSMVEDDILTEEVSGKL